MTGRLATHHSNTTIKIQMLQPREFVREEAGARRHGKRRAEPLVIDKHNTSSWQQSVVVTARACTADRPKPLGEVIAPVMHRCPP